MKATERLCFHISASLSIRANPRWCPLLLFCRLNFCLLSAALHHISIGKVKKSGGPALRQKSNSLAVPGAQSPFPSLFVVPSIWPLCLPDCGKASRWPQMQSSMAFSVRSLSPVDSRHSVFA